MCPGGESELLNVVWAEDVRKNLQALEERPNKAALGVNADLMLPSWLMEIKAAEESG